jgi:RNA polymerase sigma-70 factor (ECF subfamily)
VHATEDLLADTFLAALKGLARYRTGRQPLRHWLYRIATNAANKRVRMLRVRSTELALPQELADPRLQQLARDPDPALRRALLALKPAHQTVLVLHHVEGLGVEEIARVLGCRPGTVKSRLSRGRVALAARLGARP